MVITENLAIVPDQVAKRSETITLSAATVYTTNPLVYTMPPDILPKSMLVGPVEEQEIRFTIHGVDPVVATKVGHLVAADSELTISGADNIKNFRMVREAAVTAYVPITYLY